MSTSRDIVLVEYLTTETQTLLFAVRPNDVAPQIRAIDVNLSDLVQYVSKEFGRTAEVPTYPTQASVERVIRLDESAFQSMCGQLIAPIAELSKPGDLLWLVPHNILHYLPMHALKLDGSYLIDRNPICYTPSASVMKYCRSKRKGRRVQALAVGDSMNNLPYARLETSTVSRLFDSRILLGDDATKSRLVEEIERLGEELDILHFSCHGYFDSSNVAKSGILLADASKGDYVGLPDELPILTAEDIVKLKFHLDLVTMSACQSGVNQQRPGDELMGLTRALIYAGAASVIATLWTVEDVSTSLLMSKFYEILKNSPLDTGIPSASKASALQTAQQYLRNVTADDLVHIYSNRLNQLNSPEHEEERSRLLLDSAKAQAVAGDVVVALDTCHILNDQLENISNRWKVQLLEELNRLKEILQPLHVNSSIDYGVRPFQHPFYWAPFVLIGDWL